MQTLVIVVGSSAKGLGAAGLDMEKEISRTRPWWPPRAGARSDSRDAHGGEHGGEDVQRPDRDRRPEADHVSWSRREQGQDLQPAREKRQAQVVEVDRLAAAGAAVKTVFGQ